MKLLLILAAVFCTSLVESGKLTLKASPLVVVDTVTKVLNLDCRPSDSEAQMGLMMDIYRTDVTGQTSLAKQRIETNFMEDNRTSAEGHMRVADDEQETYLSLTITEPTFSEEGVYTCRYIYMDEMYNPQKMETSLNITVIEVPPTPEPEVPMQEEQVTGTCPCDHIMAEVNALKATLVSENARLKQEIQQFDESCRASFSARLPSRGTPITSQGIVPFSEVVSNKGGAYDAKKYTFVAPCAGQYFFSLTLRSQQTMDSGYVDGVIMVDGDEVARTSVFVDVPVTHFESATNGAMVALKQGQEVKVQIQTTSFGRFRGDAYSTFSGFYLYP